jgi:hypothetical protein
MMGRVAAPPNRPAEAARLVLLLSRSKAIAPAPFAAPLVLFAPPNSLPSATRHIDPLYSYRSSSRETTERRRHARALRPRVSPRPRREPQCSPAPARAPTPSPYYWSRVRGLRHSILLTRRARGVWRREARAWVPLSLATPPPPKAPLARAQQGWRRLQRRPCHPRIGPRRAHHQQRLEQTRPRHPPPHAARRRSCCRRRRRRSPPPIGDSDPASPPPPPQEEARTRAPRPCKEERQQQHHHQQQHHQQHQQHQHQQHQQQHQQLAPPPPPPRQPPPSLLPSASIRRCTTTWWSSRGASP